jgi:uncharacterized protein (TIGR04255 family)
MSKTKKLPTKLEKQTVLDAISEIIFEKPEDIEVLFSKVFTTLGENWTYEKLSIMNISEEIRKSNSAFELRPHFSFTNGNKIIYIGPRLLAYSHVTSNDYPGWSTYMANFMKCYSDIQHAYKAPVVRITLNFRDFFKKVNIFDHLNIIINDDLLHKMYEHGEIAKRYTTSIEVDGFEIMINVDDEVSLSFKGTEEEVSGSTIDIEVEKNINQEELLDAFNEMHQHSKNIFFNLLSDDFINTLQPTYED